MYQSVAVIGRLGKDPETRYLPSGDQAVSFSVAVSRGWVDREGQPVEKTTWFNASVFGKQAEACQKYLAKGSLVFIEGEVSARAYMARDGQPKASLDLRADTVRFLGKSEAGDEAAAHSRNPGGAAAKPKASAGLTDEMPF